MDIDLDGNRKHSAMLIDYLKIAFRKLQKDKLYAFINVSGLAIGIAACVLIFKYILHEVSYDNFHKHSENI